MGDYFSLQLWTGVNLLQPSVAFHRESNHLIFIVNQMTGFYMKCNTWMKWVKPQQTSMFTDNWTFFSGLGESNRNTGFNVYNKCSMTLPNGNTLSFPSRGWHVTTEATLLLVSKVYKSWLNIFWICYDDPCLHFFKKHLKDNVNFKNTNASHK